MIACVFAAFGVACASKPVEVTTPAIVMLDTASRNGIRMRKPAPAKNFWEAGANLDPDYATTHPGTPDERQFAASLRLVMAGQQDEAELLLDTLSRHSTDSLVRTASHILLTATLQYQDKWKELADLAPDRPVHSDSLDRAGVEAWAAAFRSVAPRRLSFPARPVILPLMLSMAGTPVIRVQINGKPKLFWLDTGSSMSIIASDVAAECGIEPLVSDSLEVATATGRITAMPATISQLEIGGISIGNSNAMIVSSKLLEIRVGDALNPSATVSIDGIIGFDLISRLDIRMDYQRGIVSLMKGVRSPGARDADRNLFWVGTPIVRLVAPGGIPVHLGLDTGAQETYATQRLVGKIRPRTFNGERIKVGGFGGLKEFRGRFISELRLSLRGRVLLLQRILVFAPSFATLITLDGVLGNDVTRTGVVRIDATNGIFSVEPSGR